LPKNLKKNLATLNNPLNLRKYFVTSLFKTSILFAFFCLFSKNSYSANLFYEIFFGPFKVGEAGITVLKDIGVLTAKVYTTGLGNKIYPYYAIWQTKIDQNGYPIQTTIYSKERNKERKKMLYFDPKNSIVQEEKFLPKKDSNSIKVSFPIHDELSGFIEVWDWQKLYPKFYIPLYIKKEKVYAIVEVHNKEKCKFLNKEITCQRINVILPEKSELLKRSREVILYMHPEERFPVTIKGSLPLFGSLKGVLKDYSK